mgnify:CR=1 FL=1
MTLSDHVSYSWLAIRRVPKERALQLLQLAVAPASGAEGSESKRAEFVLAESDEGTIIASRNFDFADHAPLEELSAEGELLTCCVHEPLMYSSISNWKTGKRQWYFFHDGNIGIQHTHIEGEPPAEFHTIANRLMVDQTEGAGLAITVDHVFEIAPQVAKALTGFRFDDAILLAQGESEALVKL